MEPESPKVKARPVPVLRYYFKAAAKYPVMLALVFIGNLIIQGAGLVSPLYLQRFVDLLAHATPNDAIIGCYSRSSAYSLSLISSAGSASASRCSP